MENERYWDARQYAYKFISHSLPQFGWQQKLVLRWILKGLFLDRKRQLAA